MELAGHARLAAGGVALGGQAVPGGLGGQAGVGQLQGPSAGAQEQGHGGHHHQDEELGEDPRLGRQVGVNQGVGPAGAEHGEPEPDHPLERA